MVTDCRACHQNAQEVLGRWTDTSSKRKFGPWRILENQGSRLVESPSEVEPLLRKLEIPDRYAQPEEAVKAVEFQAVAATIRLPGGPTGFHGALLQKEKVGLALVGIKEAGKSTLAAALFQAGWQLHSDDAFQLEDDTNLAHPVCRRARLRAGSRELVSDDFWQNLASQPASFLQPDGGLAFHSQDTSSQGVPLTHMILLKPEPGDLRELEPSDFLLQTVVHCHTYYAQGLPQTLARLAPMSNELKVYELGRNPLAKQVEILGGLS